MGLFKIATSLQLAWNLLQLFNTHLCHTLKRLLHAKGEPGLYSTVFCTSSPTNHSWNLVSKLKVNSTGKAKSLCSSFYFELFYLLGKTSFEKAIVSKMAITVTVLTDISPVSEKVKVVWFHTLLKLDSWGACIQTSVKSCKKSKIDLMNEVIQALLHQTNLSLAVASKILEL